MRRQLRYNPHGRVLSATKVSYDHGAVIIVLASPATPLFTCPSGSVCVFEGSKLKGIHAQISGPLDQNIPLGQYLSPPWLSLHNRRSYATNIDDGNGHAVCYRSGDIANNINSPYNRWPYIFLRSSGDC